MAYDVMRLSGGESLGDDALERKLLLLQVISRSILDLELGHGVRESRLNLLLLAALEADRCSRVGDHLLNAGDVRLELLPRLELLAESLVAGLELLGVVDHGLDVRRRELTDGVGDGDVGGAAGGLLGSGDLEDTVDVDLEDDLKNGFTSLEMKSVYVSCRGRGGKNITLIGGIGAKVNSPREVLSSQLTRSPWKTGNWTVLSCCQHLRIASGHTFRHLLLVVYTIKLAYISEVASKISYLQRW
jgi:hypothetical protein